MRTYRVPTMTIIVMAALVLAWGAGPGNQSAAAMGYGGGGGGGMGGGGGAGHGGGTDTVGQSVLVFEPAGLTVAPGDAAQAKATITLTWGRASVTNLKVMEAPKEVAITFAPSSGEPTFVSTMTVHAAPKAGAGTYTVKIQATDNDPSPVTPFQVTVINRSPGY